MRSAAITASSTTDSAILCAAAQSEGAADQLDHDPGTQRRSAGTNL